MHLQLMMKLLLFLILLCHLVNFLMNNLLGLERMKLLKLIILMKVMMKVLPPKYELPVVPEGYVIDEEIAKTIFACKDRYDLKKLLAKWKQQSLNARMKYDLILLLHLSLLLIRIMISLSSLR